MHRLKFLWYTDLHLSSAFPWAKLSMYRSINSENPDGLFITGDISSYFIKYDLDQIAKHIHCPIYFVNGNHCAFGHGFAKMQNYFEELTSKHKNLKWMEKEGVCQLTDDVAVIGHSGWYDVGAGDPRYLKYTFDWHFIPEIRKLKSSDDKIDYFKQLSQKSAEFIEKQLVKALEDGNHTIYLLTHFPITPEGTNDQESRFGKYWLPYNVNHKMGDTIKQIMKDYKKRTLIVLQGHTHEQIVAHIARNIISFTGKASYWGTPKNCNRIFI